MRKLYTLFLFALTSFSFGQAFTSAYDFSGIVIVSPATAPTNGLLDPTAVPNATGLTFGGFSAVISASSTAQAGSTGAGRFSYTNQPTGATNGIDTYATLTGAIDPLVYFQVTITPQSGYSINLTQITFRQQRSGTGVRTYAVRSSADSYATNLPASINPANAELSVQTGNIFFRVLDATTTGQNGSTITLSGPNFTAITAPITFRFYGWNSEASTGSFSIDDVAFTGNANLLNVKQNAISGLEVFPNPVSNGLLYITSNSNEDKTVSIFDVLGKLVVKTTVTNQPLNVSNLNKGVYILKITEDGQTATRKLVIK